MGRAKEYQMEQDDKLDAAVEVAIKAGLLTRCEFHDEIYDASTDCYEYTYKLANSMITKKDNLVAIFEENRIELTDLIKDITSSYGENCSQCIKYMKS